MSSLRTALSRSVDIARRLVAHVPSQASIPAFRSFATSTQVRLTSRPEGMPDKSNFEITTSEIGAVPDGQVLVQTKYISLDPAMRGWMKEGKSYIPPVELGAVMRSFNVAEVVESKNDKYAPGDMVSVMNGWETLSVVDPSAESVSKLPEGVPVTAPLGLLGHIGITAYIGLFDVMSPKEGETLLISGAAGAVGSVVGQLGKLHGCTVVGIAGSDAKCDYLTNDLGFDAAVNYKQGHLFKELLKVCPKGINMYFDNVGGDTLNWALALLRPFSRVSICGAISQYNSDAITGPSNYLNLLVTNSKMEGFNIFGYQHRNRDVLTELSKLVVEGKLTLREDIVEGIEDCPEHLQKLFTGDNDGKLIVKV